MSARAAAAGREIKKPIISPLRYPGGKATLYTRLKEIVRVNNLTTGTYVEPYAGGAGAALALLVTGEVRRIVINDYDPAIFAFWYAAVHQSREFSELVEKTEVSVKEWARQKDLYLTAPNNDYLTLGFATFYLNRTNRSGAINGGPIGGQDQSGNYKIDARYTKTTLLERLRLIALHSKRITVSQMDGEQVIRDYADHEDVIIYADPPYFEKAGSLYLNSFEAADHESLAECLNSFSHSRWLLTYDHVPQVAELYANRRRVFVDLNYSAHRVVKASEVMVFSDGLKVPK